MSSTNLKTPVHSHPLLAQEIPSTRGRRSRGTTNANDSADQPRRSSNYHTTRSQVAADHNGSPVLTWDGSVRGYSKTQSIEITRKGSASSLRGMWDRSPAPGPPPLFVVGSSRAESITSRPEFVVTSDSDPSVFGSSDTQKILATKWHEYSDEAIQATISNLRVSESPADVSADPYYTTIRVLSAALSNLSRVRADLEEQRKDLQEKEIARRERADALLKEVQPMEREITRRVIQSIFADADEGDHRIRRQQSHVSITDSLSEALLEDVTLPDHPVLTPMAEEHEGDLEPPPSAVSSSLPDDEGATPTLSSNERFGSRNSDDPTSQGEPTLTPQRMRGERLGWMGSIWGGKARRRTSSSVVDDASSTKSAPAKDTTPPVDDVDPIDVVQSQPPAPARRKSAKSVFETLGISLLSPAPPKKRTPSGNNNSEEPEPSSIAVPPDAETKSIRESVRSMRTSAPSLSTTASAISSPMQATFAPPSLAAPHLTTSLELADDTFDSSTTKSVAPSEVAQPLRQGSSLPAIINATRVMTSDPSSILTDAGVDTGPLVARLAFELVKNARDEGITIRKPQKERKEPMKTETPAATNSSLAVDKIGPTPTLSPSSGIDASATLSRALSGQIETLRKTKPKKGSIRQVTSPIFGAFLPQQRKSPNAEKALSPSAPSKSQQPANANNVIPSSTSAMSRKQLSVPLESIIPAGAQPPTQYLSRTYTPLTSRISGSRFLSLMQLQSSPCTMEIRTRGR